MRAIYKIKYTALVFYRQKTEEGSTIKIVNIFLAFYELFLFAVNYGLGFWIYNFFHRAACLNDRNLEKLSFCSLLMIGVCT